MDIADLRSRVLFQKNTVAIDEYGNHGNVWTDYYECFAMIGRHNLIRSKEIQAAGTVVEDHTVTVTVRWCRKAAAMSSTGFRVILDGEIYNIEFIDRLGYRNRELKLICRKARR